MDEDGFAEEDCEDGEEHLEVVEAGGVGGGVVGHEKVEEEEYLETMELVSALGGGRLGRMSFWKTYQVLQATRKPVDVTPGGVVCYYPRKHACEQKPQEKSGNHD